MIEGSSVFLESSHGLGIINYIGAQEMYLKCMPWLYNHSAEYVGGTLASGTSLLYCTADIPNEGL